MMKRATMLVVLLLAVVSLGRAQWGFAGLFPPAGSAPGDTIFTANGMHGVATDAEGKVWLLDYYARKGDSVTVPDYLVKYTTKDSTGPAHNHQVGDDSVLITKTVNVRAIHVYRRNGAELKVANGDAFNSPLLALNMGGGKFDTLGGDRLFNAKSGWWRWDGANSVNSGRGMRTGWDGNIYATLFGNVHVINYHTGAGLLKIVADANNSGVSVGTDALGDIFYADVAPGLPVHCFDNTGTNLGNVAATADGYCRTVVASSNGLDVYRAAYTLPGIQHYHSVLGPGTSYTFVDTLLPKFATESMAWDKKDPTKLWVSAGSALTPPVILSQNGKHFLYNLSTKAFVDSITWHWGNYTSEATKDERPRGIAFSASGDTAYIVMFGDGTVPGVRMFVRGLTAVREQGAAIPSGYELQQNFPNPFNPTTQINFSVPKASVVTLVLYDVLGRQVGVLMHDNLQAGKYHYTLNASSLASGTYIYELNAGDVRLAKKMLLVK